jgi:K+-sensing histidine kinase KdpD
VAKFGDYPEHEHKSIDMKLNEDGSTIKADASVMERVFENLISYALKNVSETGKVEIGSRKSQNELQYIIHDFGSQIPSKYSEEVFNKYKQTEIKKEGHRLGSGLSLTFCKLAIEAHGGSLTVDPDNKIGNRFLLNLPLTLTANI